MRRGGDSNPRSPFRKTQHFQCCTIDHSVTSPIGVSALMLEFRLVELRLQAADGLQARPKRKDVRRLMPELQPFAGQSRNSNDLLFGLGRLLGFLLFLLWGFLFWFLFLLFPGGLG